MNKVVLFLLVLIGFGKIGFSQPLKTGQSSEYYLSIIDTTEMRQFKIRAMNQLAWYYFLQFELDSADAVMNEAISLNSNGIYPKNLGMSYYYKGIIKSQKGEVDSTSIFLRNSLKIGEYLNDTTLMLYSNSALGIHFQYIFELEKSIEYFNKTISYFDEEEEKSSIAQTLVNVTNSLIDLERFDEVEENIRKIEGLTDADDDYMQAAIFLVKGRYYEAIDEPALSVNSFKRTKELNTEIGNPPFEMAAEDGMAMGYYNMGDFNNAAVHIERAISLAEESGDYNRLFDAYPVAYDIYKAQGDDKKALYYLEENQKIVDSLKSEEAMATINELEIKYESEKKDKQLFESELALQQESLEKEKSKNQNYLLLVGLILVIAILVAVYISYHQKKKNITKLKQLNDQVNSSLEEKEVLLGEIHHRVKNNLQLVSTMLKLQGEDVNDEKLTPIIEDSTRRIQTMALIHQVLYQNDDLRAIRLNTYIQDLVETIHKAIGDSKIINEFALDQIQVKIDTAIPIALIVNEIYTNSVKYAFDGSTKEQGKIKIELEDKEEFLLLKILDNGVGFNVAEAVQNFGSKLINSFARQLKAVIETQSEIGKGTLTEIKIMRFERV